MHFQYLQWSDILSHIVDLGVAFVLALPIGWDQEKEARSAGIRTFPLVAVASCGLVLVAIRVLGEHSQSQARILQGLITGIGFIGGGAILKDGRTVRGTATATSIWNTGVIGAAVGFGLCDIALVLSLINFLILRLLLPLKEELGHEQAGPTAGRQSDKRTQAKTPGKSIHRKLMLPKAPFASSRAGISPAGTWVLRALFCWTAVFPASAADAQNSLAPGTLTIGPVRLRPAGFVELIGVARSATTTDNVSTDFSSIPLTPSPSDEVVSLRHSRLMLHGETRMRGGLLTAYIETDFLSPVERPPWRLRQAWGEYSRNGWRVLAGQAWSLLRANNKGTSSERDLIDIDVIDPAYHVGLLGDRKRQVRVVREFGPKWQAAVSYEEGGYGIAKAVRDERRLHLEAAGFLGRGNKWGAAAAAVIPAGNRISLLTQQFVTRGAAREVVGGEALRVRAFSTIEGLEAKLGRGSSVFGYAGLVYSERSAGNRVVQEWSVGARHTLWDRPYGATALAAHYSHVNRATWDGRRGELAYVMVSLRHTWPSPN